MYCNGEQFYGYDFSFNDNVGDLKLDGETDQGISFQSNVKEEHLQ